MKALHALRKAQHAAARSIGVFVQDVGRGLLEISHNTLALVGLAVVTALILTAGRADIRATLETTARDWLQTRHEERATQSGDLLVAVSDQAAVARATAVDPKELTREQSSVASWIAIRRCSLLTNRLGVLTQVRRRRSARRLSILRVQARR